MLENMNMKLLDVTSHLIYHLTQSVFFRIGSSKYNLLCNTNYLIDLVLDNLVFKIQKYLIFFYRTGIALVMYFYIIRYKNNFRNHCIAVI